MRCPSCGEQNDRVLESRLNSTGTAIRRRRECCSCQRRFTSYEKIEEKPLMIIKKDGTREIFEIEKIQKGVLTALRKRNINNNVIAKMINDIEDKAEYAGRENNEISSAILGDLVLEKLKKIDDVAYIRYASVYKNFGDVNSFIDEIKKIKIGESDDSEQ